MINRAGMVWMLLAIAAGIGLFVLKYEVRAMEDALAGIDGRTLHNLEAAHVLKAEWSYLNRPARLEDLGRRLLALEPMDARQSTAVTDIPLRPDPVPDPEAHGPGVSPAAGHPPPSLATYRRER